MNYRKRALLPAAFAVLFLFNTVARAAEVTRFDITEPHSTPQNSLKTAAEQPHKLFMWKVTNGKSTVYLVGSIHLVKPDLYPLPNEMEKAFNRSDELVLEIDETRQDSPDIQQLTISRGMYPEGDHLTDHISKETKEQLGKYLQTGAITDEQFTRMKPWLASLMIPLVELQRRGFDSKQGIDKHFHDQAHADNKPIDQLESVEFQFNLLSGFNDDLQDKLLLSSLLDLAEIDPDTEHMLHAWRTGDEQEMLDVVTRDEKERPELKPVMHKLLYERNPHMAKSIEAYLKNGKTYFVVVGAGHLVGKQGIVQLLRDKKYQVEQISGS